MCNTHCVCTSLLEYDLVEDLIKLHRSCVVTSRRTLQTNKNVTDLNCCTSHVQYEMISLKSMVYIPSLLSDNKKLLKLDRMKSYHSSFKKKYFVTMSLKLESIVLSTLLDQHTTHAKNARFCY